MHIPDLPEDWHDLPPPLQDHIPEFKWPHVRGVLGLLLKLNAFSEQAGKELAASAAEIDRLSAVAPILDALRRLRAVLETVPRPGSDQSPGERLKSALDDVVLEINIAMAEAQRRVDRATAATAEHWAHLPQRTLPKGIQKLVSEWQGGKREEFLSRLPLEDRREIERRYE